MDLALTAPTADCAAATGCLCAGKYLTFAAGNLEFGVDVQAVRAIIGVPEITRVPRTPAFLKGVINLRGKLIPVIDLRLKLGLGEGVYADRTCIIAVQIEDVSARSLMGIVVDEVSEVITVRPKNIEKVPSFGSAVDTQYILGITRLENRVRSLLDIHRVLACPRALTAREFSGLELVAR